MAAPSFGNFVASTNPFGLADPPAWFLRDLFAYDPALVLFASNAEAVYRLCRRAKGTIPWQRFPPGHLDNQVCIDNRMVPLKAVQPVGTQWGQIVIANLAACDTQRHGGGTKFAELLEEQEQLEERRLDVAIADEADARAGVAYRTIQSIEGSRVSLAAKTHEGGGYRKNPFGPKKAPRRVFRPRDSGDHAIFVGR